MWYFMAGLLVVVVGSVMLYERARGEMTLRRVCRRSALSLSVAFGVFGGLFLGGELFTDPGGWEAVGWTALLFLPTAAVALSAWFRSDRMMAMLIALTTAAVGLQVWAAFDPDGWQAFQEDRGPVLAIVLFLLSIPLGLYGWRRPIAAGVMLVIVGVAPLLWLGTNTELAEFRANLVGLGFPAFASGVLYLIAGRRTPVAAEDLSEPADPHAVETLQYR